MTSINIIIIIVIIVRSTISTRKINVVIEAIIVIIIIINFNTFTRVVAITKKVITITIFRGIRKIINTFMKNIINIITSFVRSRESIKLLSLLASFIIIPIATLIGKILGVSSFIFFSLHVGRA